MATAAVLGSIPLSRQRNYQALQWKPSLRTQVRLAFPQNIKSCNLHSKYPNFTIVNCVEKSSKPPPPPPPRVQVELADKKTILLDYAGGIAFCAVRIVFIRQLRSAIDRDLSYLGPAFRVVADSDIYAFIISWATIFSTVSLMLDLLPTAVRKQFQWAATSLGHYIQKEHIEFWFAVAAYVKENGFPWREVHAGYAKSVEEGCDYLLEVVDKVCLCLKDHWMARLLHIVLAWSLANLIIIGLFKKLYWGDKGAIFSSRGFGYSWTVSGVASFVLLVVTCAFSSEEDALHFPTIKRIKPVERDNAVSETFPNVTSRQQEQKQDDTQV